MLLNLNYKQKEAIVLPKSWNMKFSDARLTSLRLWHVVDQSLLLLVAVTRVLSGLLVAARGILWKKSFLKIQQYSQENSCVGAWRPAALLKRCSNASVFLWILNTYFEEHLQTAGSEGQPPLPVKV